MSTNFIVAGQPWLARFAISTPRGCVGVYGAALSSPGMRDAAGVLHLIDTEAVLEGGEHLVVSLTAEQTALIEPGAYILLFVLVDRSFRALVSRSIDVTVIATERPQSELATEVAPAVTPEPASVPAPGLTATDAPTGPDNLPTEAQTEATNQTPPTETPQTESETNA